MRKIMNYIDLHVHSTCSDGTFSPSELVKLANQHMLSAFALTDHDTVGGIFEAQKTAKELTDAGHPVRVIPGVELSAAYKEREIHILGLLIDDHNPALLAALESAIKNREQRNAKMLEKLQNGGFDISDADLYNGNKHTVITKAHFANALILHGYTRNITEAFRKYLDFGRPYYVPREYVAPEEAIRLIRLSGGIPILAHPLLYHLDLSELDALITRLQSCGLLGIEAIYSSNTNQDEQYLRSLARRRNLVVSGGSDFHGDNKPALSIGTGRGNLRIPESILTELEHLQNTLF